MDKPAAGPLIAVGVTLVCWASAFVAIRYLADDFRPGALALGRMLVGTACLSLVVLWSRGQGVRLVRPTRPQWLRIVVIGVLWYAVYMVALNTGERHVDAGTASLVLQLSPVVIAVLAAIFLGETFTSRLGIGLAMAFLGVVLIAFASDGGTGDHPVLGVALCLISVASYSVSVILQKPLAGRISAIQLTWTACAIGTAAMLPWLGQLVDDLASAPASSIFWLAYLGVFPTAIAFTTYGYALEHLTASQLGISTYAVPVISIALAAVFLGEVPAPLAYVGGALALAGVAVARRRPRVG